MIVTYQTLLPNGSLYNVTSGCANQQWMWAFSPYIYALRPAILNRDTLLMMNYFHDWNPPHLLIRVPLPCSNVAMEFLLQMTISVCFLFVCVFTCVCYVCVGICALSSVCMCLTICTLVYLKINSYQALSKYSLFILFDTIMQLLDYSEGQRGPHRNSQRYARVGCPNQQGRTEFELPVFSESNDEMGRYLYNFVYGVGVVCTMTFVSLGILATSKQKLATLAELTKSYSYQEYGLYWGLSATASVFVIFVAYINSQTLYMGMHDIPNHFWPLLCAILVFGILSSLMTAVYLAYKYKPVTTPLLVWTPFMILCCCRKNYTKYATFTVNLWINIIMIFVQGLICHGLVNLLAMLIAPFAILCDITVVILSLFCFTNIFAILFTISAHISTPRHLRPQGSSTAILRAAYLIPLLVAVMCFSSVVAAGAYWINEETKQASYISSFATFAIPLFIAVITIGLKYFVQYWLKGTLTGVNTLPTVRGYGSTEEMKPLL